MPVNSTEFRFVLGAYTPDTIPQARLGQYLTALAELYGDKAAIHFVGLEEGSLVIKSRADEDVEDDVSERLEAAYDEDGPPDARKAYANLAQMVREDRSPARIERQGAVIIKFPTGERLAADAPLVYGPFWQRGHLNGTVILIGGKSDLVSVKIQTKDHAITCKARRDVAKELRDYLWGASVRVEGSGKWIRDEDGVWKLLRFQITSFDPLDDESLTATVARLRAIEGKWKDRPDPIGELEALRNDEPDEK